MLARFPAAVVGFVLLAGLAGAMAVLAQEASPTPTPVSTTSVAPTPVVTPVGCQIPTPGVGPSPTPTATGGPAAPSGLRAEPVPDPELASGLAVELTWQDNAGNETCFVVAVRMHGELIRTIGTFATLDGSTTGLMTLKEFPDRTGLHCYQVYFGNSAGQSYSNEACVNVAVLPVWGTPPPVTPLATRPSMPPTPLPAGCQGQGPVGSPGTPKPPANLRAELVRSPELLEGLAIRLTWDDSTADDLCYIVEWKVSPEDWPGVKNVGGHPPSWMGPVSVEDIPWRVGIYCYRVYFGNETGRSTFSNEACVNVEVAAKVVTPTPPLFAPTPASPANTATAAATPAVRALPATGGGESEGAAGLPWWALAFAGSALLGVAALSLARAARRRQRPSR